MNNDWEFDYQSQYQRGYTQPVQPVQPLLPTQEMAPAYSSKKRSKAKSFFKGLGIVSLCAVVGFGSGLAGASVVSKGGNSVIYQAVDNNNQLSQSGTDTTTGTALTTSQVAAKAAPSVVEVTTEALTTDSFFGQQVLSGAGSGVIISADGYIITNAHVIADASNIKVKLADGTEHEAKIIGSDTKTDIAILKIEATGLQSAVIGNSDKLNVGEFALAIGNPLGSLGGTVTNGIISALNRDVVVGGQTMNLMQTNAAVSPGNSGGGLFNERGELVGIVNAKSAQTDSEGIGFAIPINTAMQVATDLMENGYVSGRPAIGVMVLTISDLQTAYQAGVKSLGIYISEIVAGGGADKAGLMAGDRIVGIDDTLVSSASDLTGAINSKKVGETVEIQVERDGRLVKATVTLEEMGAES